MAGEKIMVDEMKLQLYLKKCELEYRAKHSQKAECLDWLAPYCGTVEEIARFLRDLGFRIKNIVDEDSWPGEKHQWVETTSGILVYVGTDGLFAKRMEFSSKYYNPPG